MLYTDLGTAEERIQALELGASDLISRPFAGAEVLARLRAALRIRHLLTILSSALTLTV
ncbi:MAG: hypothetical protein ACXVBO_08695 [Isosphaeraceae bacterium]